MNAVDRTDEALMALLCQGNKTSLAELVNRYQQDVFRFCLHYLRDVERAKELAQETFLRVYTACDRFDSARTFRPWMVSIARNLCLNELKRRKIVPMVSLEDCIGDRQKTDDYGPHSKVDSPAQALMQEERREVLCKALDKLNADARELVMLRYFQQMSAKEIAELLGSTEGAIRTRLHRALNLLRDKHLMCREDL